MHILKLSVLISNKVKLEDITYIKAECLNNS